MILQKKTINNVPQFIHLTADTGTGAPVGSYLYLEKKSNPQGYLFCDGSTFDETVYPALYQYLGTNVLPDWREFSPVGAEQNTTSSVIATHDVFTQGQEKDDQLQKHTHDLRMNSANLYANGTANNGFFYNSSPVTDTVNTENCRSGSVTRGKSKAAFIYIKATSGLTENQQENVLNTINENLSYSTTEQPTGAKWIDGKPIYRKVYNFASLEVSNNYILENDAAFIDTFINYGGSLVWKSTGNLLPFPWSTPETYAALYRNTTQMKLLMQINLDASAQNLRFFIEYTKTTN